MSHGFTRISDEAPLTEEAKKLRQEKIDDYRSLVSNVNQRVSQRQFDDQTLALTSKLLSENPEYYTVWNHRRRILSSKFEEIKASNMDDTDFMAEQISRLLSNDLRFLVPLLQKFPKCYWLWNHRSWALKQTIKQLPTGVAMKFWSEELGLVGKMLSRDNRNFHAWDYRRNVVTELEQLSKLQDGGSSMTQQEYDYTRKMIEKDLSNFSAWHARSRLLLRLATENSADQDQRKKMLEEELELIHDALIDPKDQSLWYYHDFLILTFDPSTCATSIAPQLSTEERLQYLQMEIDYVKEILDSEEDLKWVYLSLIQLASLFKVQGGNWPKGFSLRDIEQWKAKIQDIDPMRRERWEAL